MHPTAQFEDFPGLNSAEVQGTVLLGFLQACTNLHIIAQGDRQHLAGDVAPGEWYPIEKFCQFQDFILREFKDAHSILEQAGVEFARLWLSGREENAALVGGIDFLILQTGSEGYASVIRGTREAVGCFELVELDRSSGRAVVESSTPFSRDFERGVLTGGMMAGGAFWYVKVDNEHNPDRFLIRFRPGLERIESSFCPIPSPEAWHRAEERNGEFVDELFWRYQGALEELRRERSFWLATNATLERLAGRLQTVSRQMEDLAHRDSLTGIPNRRGILQVLEREFGRSLRYGLPLCIAILDLDWFKRINDTHGHLIGDQVLQMAAKALAGSLRMSDTIGRLSGEEFLVILPGDDLDEACAAADKLRRELARLAFLGKYGEFHITASFGLARRSSEVGDAMELMRRADQALYRAKEGGRNRIERHL